MGRAEEVRAAGGPDPIAGFGFSDKVVLAYYYMWYTEEKWLNPPDEGGRRELEGLHPLVGAYNSWDPAIIDRHSTTRPSRPGTARPEIPAASTAPAASWARAGRIAGSSVSTIRTRPWGPTTAGPSRRP